VKGKIGIKTRHPFIETHRLFLINKNVSSYIESQKYKSNIESNIDARRQK